MKRVLDPLRKVFSKRKIPENENPAIHPLSNEVQSLHALKKELDEKIANYSSTIVVIKI